MKELLSKNYILFTFGSLVSMLGSHIAWFAMGLLIYTETESILQFAMYCIVTTLPQIIIPLLISPYIDRYSRKKIIVFLDYLFGGLFLCFYFYLSQGRFQYSWVVGFSLLINTLDSVYSLAFYGLFPDVTPKGQMQRASVILGSLPFLADALGLPLAAWLNASMGVAVLMVINGISYLLTATMEIFIKVEEKLNAQDAVQSPVQQYVEDLRSGWQYVRQDPALWGLSTLYAVCCFAESLGVVAILPFFIDSPELNESMYANAAGIVGFVRIVGSLVLLVVIIPKRYRSTIFMVAVALSMMFGNLLLSVSYGWYVVFQASLAAFGLVSYTLRHAGVSQYVAPEKRGRFYAIFHSFIMLGLMLGYFAMGIASQYMSISYSYTILHAIALIIAVVLIIHYRKPWKQLFQAGD